MKNVKEVLPVIAPKDIVIGAADAPITLMEFGDYESEACAKAQEAVNELLEKHSGKINFIFRHFPLTKYHQKAHKAAEAAIGAAQEGRFWEMHNELFRNRRNLGVISLKSHAKEVGVSNKNFLNDLINGVYGWHVQADLMEGIKLGVKEVPTFFINGVLYEGEPTFEKLNAKLKAFLKNPESIPLDVSKKRRA